LILAIDAGNSRVKWAMHDGSKFVHDGWTAHADLHALDAQWAELPTPSSIVIGNVAGEHIGQKLRALCMRWKPEPHWASSVRSQAGVFNNYDEPSQLGVDRWAALIGARGICFGACVVANAGTAMTIDALGAQGEFIGGIVVPGFELMHEALAANTAKLSAQQGKFVVFPRTTRDAITSGAIQALCGAVERMRNALLLAGHESPELIISGGTSEMIARHIGGPVRVVDKLVLEGLVRIAMEQA
jgi:type III pantothenate kinase